MKSEKLDAIDIATRIIYLLLLILLLIGCYFGGRAYVADWFVIPTSSMRPALIPGDRVIVNKLVVGARIYDEFDFGDGVPMKSHRTKGFRTIKPNDIVVFNFPINHYTKEIEFKLNYVYCKRCIGVAGDTVSIVDGYYKNNNFDGVLGDVKQQELLSSTPNTLISKGAFNAKKGFGWNIKNYGPLYVPKSGETIAVSKTNYLLYKQVIEFETDKKLFLDKKSKLLMLGEDEISSYTFTKNYYFMCGDNVLDSNDSRYWGFVPEEFIVGVATRIIFSIDKTSDKFRWNRFMRVI